MQYLVFTGQDAKTASHSLALTEICQQCRDSWLADCKWFHRRLHKDSANCPQMVLVPGAKGCQWLRSSLGFTKMYIHTFRGFAGELTDDAATVFHSYFTAGTGIQEGPTVITSFHALTSLTSLTTQAYGSV